MRTLLTVSDLTSNADRGAKAKEFPKLKEGGVGIFCFSDLAIGFRSVFLVLLWNKLRFFGFAVRCCEFFPFFSIWSSVSGMARVFRIWCLMWFSFFYVLSVTSHGADTVMILIFSIKTDVMLFSPHVTNVSDRWSGFWKLKSVYFHFWRFCIRFYRNLLRVFGLGWFFWEVFWFFKEPNVTSSLFQAFR